MLETSYQWHIFVQLIDSWGVSIFQVFSILYLANSLVILPDREKKVVFFFLTRSVSGRLLVDKYAATLRIHSSAWVIFQLYSPGRNKFGGLEGGGGKNWSFEVKSYKSVQCVEAWMCSILKLSFPERWENRILFYLEIANKENLCTLLSINSFGKANLKRSFCLFWISYRCGRELG